MESSYVWKTASSQECIDNYQAEYLAALTYYCCRYQRINIFKDKITYGETYDIQEYVVDAFLFPAAIDIMGKQKEIMIDYHWKGLSYGEYRQRLLESNETIEFGLDQEKITEEIKKRVENEEKIIENYQETQNNENMWAYVFVRRRTGKEDLIRNLKIFEVELEGFCLVGGETSLIAQKCNN